MTADELEALPVGSVIDEDGQLWLKVHTDRVDCWKSERISARSDTLAPWGVRLVARPLPDDAEDQVRRILAGWTDNQWTTDEVVGDILGVFGIEAE